MNRLMLPLGLIGILGLLSALLPSRAPVLGKGPSAAGLLAMVTRAEGGQAAAQFNLGARYSAGDGVPKDSQRAVEWYRKAAEQGHPKAQVNLGLAYANGDGVAKDLEEAAGWYRRTAEAGYPRAQFNLGLCYALGAGVSKDTTEAARWYREAAEQDLAEAQNNLGSCHVNGEGVTQDRVEGYAWYAVAAANRDRLAASNKAAMSRTMTVNELRLARQRSGQLRQGLAKRQRKTD